MHEYIFKVLNKSMDQYELNPQKKKVRMDFSLYCYGFPLFKAVALEVRQVPRVGERTLLRGYNICSRNVDGIRNQSKTKISFFFQKRSKFISYAE